MSDDFDFGTAIAEDHERHPDEPIPGQERFDAVDELRERSEAVQEFEQEAGLAVGPMPPQTPRDEPDPDVSPDEVKLRGTTQLGVYSGAGKAPSKSTIKFKIPKLALMDQDAFEKGEVIDVRMSLQIVAVTDRDTIDKPTGIVMECVHEHEAILLDVELT